MKKLLVAATASFALGCGPADDTAGVDIDLVIEQEVARIESLLENCLEGEREFRHHICFERAIRRIDELADRYDIDLDAP